MLSGDERRSDLRLVVLGQVQLRFVADLGVALALLVSADAWSVEPDPPPCPGNTGTGGAACDATIEGVLQSTRVVSIACAGATYCVWPLRMRSNILDRVLRSLSRSQAAASVGLTHHAGHLPPCSMCVVQICVQRCKVKFCSALKVASLNISRHGRGVPEYVQTHIVFVDIPKDILVLVCCDLHRSDSMRALSFFGLAARNVISITSCLQNLLDGHGGNHQYC